VRLREHRHNLQQDLLEKSKLAQLAYEEGQRVGFDEARILEIESNHRFRKYKESAHMACSTNTISEPTLDFSRIWIPLISNELPTHREDLYDVTDSSWVSIRFQSRVFRFYSTDGASGRQYECIISRADGHYLGLFFCIYNYFSQ
jgi:hypothetical protein